MKKIVLNEVQADKLVKKLVSEQYADDDRYTQEVRCSFEYRNKMFKGNEIDWVDDVPLNMSFKIDMDYKSYGIKDINIYDVRGPEEVEINVTYFIEGSEDPVDEDVIIRLNWSDISTEEADIGWIGIGHEMEIDLLNDEEGNLIGSRVTILTKEI